MSITTEDFKCFVTSKAIKSKRSNQRPFVTKDLFKETVKRLKPRNSNFKNKTNANRMLYKKQRYYCVSILRKITTNLYANLVKKGVFDNKAFWKVIRLLHSDKTNAKKQINLGKKWKF